MTTELEVDEIALSEFFGTPPTAQDPEEKEFFGTSIFDVSRASFQLSISFSTYHRDMCLYLKSEGKEILKVHVTKIDQLRIRDDGKALFVMKRAAGSSGSDPALEEAASIIMDSLSIKVECTS